MATITRATTIPPMDTNILMIDAARLQRPSPRNTQDSAGSALPLLIWLSPAFPVGAFAYSHGLEAAVEAGDITNAATLQAWLDDLVRYGSLRADALLADGVVAGVPYSRLDPHAGLDDVLLLAATETTTRDDIAALASALHKRIGR